MTDAPCVGLVGLLQTAVRPNGTILTEAGLLRLNDVWLLGVPGELLPKLGLAIP